MMCTDVNLEELEEVERSAYQKARALLTDLPERPGTLRSAP